jgi:hypothetical protein
LYPITPQKLLKSLKWVQVAKTHLSFATALLWHQSFEITLKLYLYGKYSIQTIIFWSLCAFIWFRNIEKMLLQMTSVSLQPVPSLDFVVYNGWSLYSNYNLAVSNFLTNSKRPL